MVLGYYFQYPYHKNKINFKPVLNLPFLKLNTTYTLTPLQFQVFKNKITIKI